MYKHNCEVFDLWAHNLPTGMNGDLGDRNALLTGTKVFSQAFDVNDVPTCGRQFRTGCINADCIGVAKELIEQGYRPAIFNLASRRHPCGGYDAG